MALPSSSFSLQGDNYDKDTGKDTDKDKDSGKGSLDLDLDSDSGATLGTTATGGGILKHVLLANVWCVMCLCDDCVDCVILCRSSYIELCHGYRSISLFLYLSMPMCHGYHRVLHWRANAGLLLT